MKLTIRHVVFCLKFKIREINLHFVLSAMQLVYEYNIWVKTPANIILI